MTPLVTLTDPGHYLHPIGLAVTRSLAEAEKARDNIRKELLGAIRQNCKKGTGCAGVYACMCTGGLYGGCGCLHSRVCISVTP